MSAFHSFDEATRKCLKCDGFFDTDFYKPCNALKVQPCCGKEVGSVWDPVQNAWKCQGCFKYGNSGFGSAWGDDDTFLPRRKLDTQAKVCECGAEKTYGITAGHSSWCPKYEG